jgi:hypothetical protein
MNSVAHPHLMVQGNSTVMQTGNENVAISSKGIDIFRRPVRFTG